MIYKIIAILSLSLIFSTNKWNIFSRDLGVLTNDRCCLSVVIIDQAAPENSRNILINDHGAVNATIAIA